MRIQGKWLLVCCWQVFFCVQTDAATSETSSPPLSCDGQVVPDAWINDGYCDCSDGSDETTTEACSGHEYWPGHAEEEVVVK